MKTRSQTRKESESIPIIYEKEDLILNVKKELEVNIDFDEASRCWMKNKKKLKNGCYIYKTKINK